MTNESMQFRRQWSPILVTLSIGLASLLMLCFGCQRTVAPELPYDSGTADEIRKDLDQFAEPG